MASPQASSSDKAHNNGASFAGGSKKGTRKQSGKQSVQQSAKQSAKQSARSAPTARNFEVKGNSSLGYTRVNIACGKSSVYLIQWLDCTQQPPQQ